MGQDHLVSFIGAGNLAWHLAPALDNAGLVVREVYSRSPSHAEALTERLYQAEVKATLDFSTSNSTIFIICVSDNAIQNITQEIILPDEAILVHTSGTQPLNHLQYAATNNIGVLYPLQTFSKERKIDFSTIPIFIEAANLETEKILWAVGNTISKQVVKISSEQRKALHVSAVFASNFVNHLLTIANDILQQHNLAFNWLEPLVVETIQKSLRLNPAFAQTGPAKRGDLEVLDSHVEFLNDNASMTEIYKLISQDIIDRYH